MRECIRAQEAAELLGLSPWTIYKLAREGRLPHVRIGARVLFRRSTIMEWLARQEAGSLSGNPGGRPASADSGGVG